MGFDNRIFNVNGETKEQLFKAIDLAFSLDLSKQAKAWRFIPSEGLVFLWSKSEKSDAFPIPLTSEQCADMAYSWIQTEEAKSMKFEGWDADCDHDGDNSLGWRVFLGEWGQVASEHYAICVVRPAYVWYGK